MRKKIKKIIAYSIWQFQDPYFQGAAPQLAFFLFISIFPLVLLLSKLLGFFSISLLDIQNWINIDISGEGTRALENFMAYDPSSGSNILLIILAIWGGSRIHFSLSRITNYTYTDGKFTGQGWLIDRARSIAALIIILLTLVAILVTLIYVPNIMDTLILNDVLLEQAQNFWISFRWLIVLALYFFTISYIYFALPKKRVKYKEIIPGTILSSVTFLLATVVYNSYVSHNMGNNLIYGSLSSIFALAIWLWILSWIIIIGICFNRIIWIIRKDNPIPLDSRVIDRRIPFSIGKIRNWVNEQVKDK